MSALRAFLIPTTRALRGDRVAQAFTSPVLFGGDTFAGVLTDDWTRYLAPDIIPGIAFDAMHVGGVIEIVAGRPAGRRGRGRGPSRRGKAA